MASVELSKQILPLDLVPILPKPKTIDAKGWRKTSVCVS
jgi:hypothetical protein